MTFTCHGSYRVKHGLDMLYQGNDLFAAVEAYDPAAQAVARSCSI